MTAPVRVACPHCQAGLKLRSREYLQRKITCPGCQQSFVPEPEQAFDMLDVVDDEPDELETESPAPSAPTPLKRSAEPANVPFAQGAVATRSTDGPTLLGDDDFVSAPVARGDSRGGHPSVSRPEPAFDALEVIEDDPEEFDYEAPPSPTPQRGNRNLEPAIDPPPAKSTPARPAARAKSQREEEADDDRESQPQRGTTSRSKRRPKSSGVPWRGMIVVAVVLSVALGLFLVPWRKLAPNLGGFGDTPEGLSQEYLAELQKMEGSLAGLRNGRNRAEVVAELKQEDERLDAIYRRTVRLSPQNDADAQSTLLKTGPTISTIQSSRLTVVIQLSAAGMTDPQLNTMATQVELSAMGTVRGLTSGLRDAPTPQNDAERIQAEWVAAQRSVVVALSRVEKPADLRTAANELTSQKLKLEQLAARVRLLTPTEMANYTAGLQRFSGRLSALGMEFSALQQDLTMRHGHVAEFQRELANFEFARQQLEQAPGAGQNMAQVPQIGGFPVGPPGIPPNAIPGNVPLPPGVGAPPGFGGPPGINPGAFPDGFPRGFPGQGPGPFPGGPPGVAMPGGFPRIPSNVDEFAQNFIQQHGKDKTVILLIPGKVLNSNEQQRITEQMQSTFGAISASSAFSGGVTNSTMFAYALEGDIRQIAGKIKFAKVTAIDAANRRITIEVP